MSAVADLAIHLALLLVVPPFLVGVIQKTKAWFGGRRGPPLLQPYRDIWKLLRKGAVYSRTTTWLFRAGPIVSLATVFAAGLLLPLTSDASPLGFEGDVVLFAYLLGLGRLFTVLAALDTGSSFEGMGASREATFSAFAELALFLSLASICIPAGSATFGDAFAALRVPGWGVFHPAYLPATITLVVVLLTECSRIPVDDPATHLELTMVHEVMVLDHGGPDLAFIQVGSAMKIFVLGALVVRVALPVSFDAGGAGIAWLCAGELGIAILIGVIESVFARLRLPRVPQFLVGASVLAAIGLLAVLYRGGP